VAPGINVQIAIDINSFICLDFHPSDPLAGHDTFTVVQRRLELIAPRTPIAIAIPIVIATQKLAFGFATFLHSEGNIDGFQELFGEVWRDLGEGGDVLRGFGGW
jgi:hypothetical protein